LEDEQLDDGIVDTLVSALLLISDCHILDALDRNNGCGIHQSKRGDLW